MGFRWGLAEELDPKPDPKPDPKIQWRWIPSYRAVFLVIDLAVAAGVVVTVFYGVCTFLFHIQGTAVCHKLRQLHRAHNKAMGAWATRYYLMPTPALPEYECVLPVQELSDLMSTGIVAVGFGILGGLSQLQRTVAAPWRILTQMVAAHEDQRQER